MLARYKPSSSTWTNLLATHRVQWWDHQLKLAAWRLFDPFDRELARATPRLQPRRRSGKGALSIRELTRRRSTTIATKSMAEDAALAWIPIWISG